jgi:predicted RNA binding protein YcfA (HicA-like mRNA interferase family)
MPELNGFSGKRAVAVLEKMGFKHVRTKGSHAVMRNNSRSCVVPLHSELAAGTLKSVLRQAGVTPEDFMANA